MAEDETLSETFRAVSSVLRHLSRQTLAPWDVSPSHARALFVLARHQPMRLSELAEHLHIAPRSATEVIDGLQERGLVERRPDPDDRRATLVSLTRSGQETATAIRSARGAEAEAFFGVLSATDQAQLERILRQLVEPRSTSWDA